jgi:uncharacterized membrane protein
MTTTRLEAFSDGVLAIIITIMVLEIRVPHGVEWNSLRPLIPVFYSYILSFLFVGIYWGNHHHLLHTVKHVSWRIMWANMHLLFWLSLVPFATGWMGENHFAQNTVIMYAIVLFFCGVGFTILQLSIQREHPDNPQLISAYGKLRRKGIFSLIGYLSAIPLALVNTTISALIFLSIAITWLIPDRNIEKAVTDKG